MSALSLRGLKKASSAAFAAFALLVACSSSEPTPMPLVANYVVRFPSDMPRATRVAIWEGMRPWTETGAVELLEGDDWTSLPAQGAEGPCTDEVHVAWLQPDDPRILHADGTFPVGWGEHGCGLRLLGLVSGRVPPDELGLVGRHELGHAMGLDHVPEGIMASKRSKVADRPSCDDWRAFCSVLPCPTEPCP